MQDLRLWLTGQAKPRSGSQPRLYVQMRLNYTDSPVCNRSKRRETQRLYNWLSSVRPQVSSQDLVPSQEMLLKNKKKQIKSDDPQRLINLSRRYQKLKNFTKLNLDRELADYIYGSPSKQSLDQMQIQLRCFTGEKRLLLKVCDTVDRRIKKADAQVGDETSSGQVKKGNELVLSLDVLAKVFKRLHGESLPSEDGSLVLELTGYRFRAVLVLVYALYTNQLYLSLGSFPEIIRVSLDLGVEQILKFVNRLILNEDPIYLLFKLRKYLADLARLSDATSLTGLARQMADVLRQVVVHYDRIIRHPAVLDLTFREINFLVWKKREAFKSFGVNVCRNERDVIRAVLDWHMVDREHREQQAICLLSKVDYGQLTGGQLENLVNNLLLNGYSDEVNSFLRSQFACESERRPGLRERLFQILPRSNQPDSCLLGDLARAGKSSEPAYELTQSEIRLGGLQPSKIEQDADREEREQELKELLSDCMKNFLHLGSFSLGGGSSLSPIYSLSADRSIMLLLGGFRSSLPSKDQGRLMYHLIRTQANDVALPSIQTHDWFPLQRRLPKNLAHFAAVRVLNWVFVIGGLDLTCLLRNNHVKRVKPTASCFVFNLTTSDWYKIASMNSSRAFHGAVNHDQLIYVFGGLTLFNDQLSVSGTMEFYDIAKNSWFSVNCDPSPGAR